MSPIIRWKLLCHLQRYWSLSSVPSPHEQGEALLSGACNVGRYAYELYLHAIAGNLFFL